MTRELADIRQRNQEDLRDLLRGYNSTDAGQQEASAMVELYSDTHRETRTDERNHQPKGSRRYDTHSGID